MYKQFDFDWTKNMKNTCTICGNNKLIEFIKYLKPPKAEKKFNIKEI